MSPQPTMQAVVFPEPNHVEVRHVPRPVCAPGEVLVRVSRAGLCGTDLHIYRNEYMATLPLTPGHEFVGVIEGVGEVANGAVVGGSSTWAVGDRVVVDPNLYCHTCDHCRRGMHNHCLHWQGVGITRAGGFAEYVAVPAGACYRVGAALDDVVAAWVEPVACVVHAMRRMPIEPGERALVFGAGPMGLLLVQALRHRGAGTVVVVEPQPERRRQAEAWGATAIDSDKSMDDALAEGAHRSSGGYDVVIDATGLPGVIQGALRWLGPRGRFLQFGVAPRGARIEIEPFELFHRDWSLIGSFALSCDFEAAIGWLEQGVLDVRPLVSDVVGLAGFADALDRFGAGRTMKVHLTPSTP